MLEDAGFSPRQNCLDLRGAILCGDREPAPVNLVRLL